MAVAEAKRRDGPGFSALPERCIASVVSFTSPSDACRLASVSPVFKSACDSDAVWASFLPSDWHLVVSRCASSLKELYFSLCDDPVLVNDGKMSFPLDGHSEKECIMLSARALSITGGDTRSNWSWNHMPNSRFTEVVDVELMEAYLLQIRGTISPRMLSPRTLYAAYLVFKLTRTSNGFEVPLFEVGAGFAGDEVGKRERSIHLSRTKRASGPPARRHRRGVIPLAPDEGDDGAILKRDEMGGQRELGEFLTEDGQHGEVAMNVLDTRHWRLVGLAVEGIEIRPKDGKQKHLYARHV